MAKPVIWKGIVAGAVGGLVACWTMDQFQKVWTSVSEEFSDEKPKRKSTRQPDDPTMKTADAISELVQGRHLTKPEKKKGGPVVHYAFGTLMGAAYGATVEIAPSAKTLSGIPFGTILFAGADEVAVLALGLSKSRAAYPIASHAYGLASHAVYGITAELVRRLIRSKI
jgi:putative membrane protein